MGLDSRHTGHGWELVAWTEGDTELRSEVAQAALCCVLLRIALCCIGQWSWSSSLHDRAEKFRRSQEVFGLCPQRSAHSDICFVEKSEKKFSMHRASVVKMLDVDRGEVFKELPGQ